MHLAIGVSHAVLSFVRVLLRHRETKQFLGQKGKWVTRIEDAVDFKDSLAATEAKETCGIQKTEIIFKLKGGIHDILLPTGF